MSSPNHPAVGAAAGAAAPAPIPASASAPAAAPSGSAAPGTTTAAPATTGPRARDKLVGYALDNPLKLASVAMLAIGGVLLLVYFIRLGFLPDINIENSTTLLYAVSLLGLFALICACGYLLMPGLLIATTIEQLKITDDKQRKYLAGIAASSSGIGLLVAIGLAVVLPQACGGAIVGVLIGILTAAVLGGFLSILLVENVGWSAHLAVACLSLVLVVVLAFLVAVTGPGAERAAIGQSGLAPFAALLPTLLSLAFGAFLGVSGMKDLWWRVSLFGPVLLFTTLLLNDAFAGPSRFVVQKLGLGEVDTARVVVNGKACKQINMALGVRVCNAVADDALMAVCPVALRSRIGSQILLEFAPMGVIDIDGTRSGLVWHREATKAEGARGDQLLVRRVVLDKSDVKTWSVLPPHEEQTAGRNVSSQPATMHRADDDLQKRATLIAELCGKPEVDAPDKGKDASEGKEKKEPAKDKEKDKQETETK